MYVEATLKKKKIIPGILHKILEKSWNFVSAEKWEPCDDDDTANNNSGHGNNQDDEDDYNNCENNDSQYNHDDCLIYNIQN